MNTGMHTTRGTRGKSAIVEYVNGSSNIKIHHMYTPASFFLGRGLSFTLLTSEWGVGPDLQTTVYLQVELLTGLPNPFTRTIDTCNIDIYMYVVYILSMLAPIMYRMTASGCFYSSYSWCSGSPSGAPSLVVSMFSVQKRLEIEYKGQPMFRVVVFLQILLL